MNLKTKALLYLACVFSTGFLLGFAAHSLADRYTGASDRLSFADYHSKPQMVAGLTKELDLMPEQAARLEKIIDSSRRHFIALQDDFKPRCDKITKKTISEIRTILTPEQVERFNRFLKKHPIRRKQPPTIDQR